MARHAAALTDEPLTAPIPLPAPPVVLARRRWPITALVLTLVARVVIVAGGTLLTVQLVHPAALAAPSSAPSAPAPLPSPAPLATPLPADPPAASSSSTEAAASTASSSSTGSEAPIPGSLRVGGPSCAGATVITARRGLSERPSNYPAAR